MEPTTQHVGNTTTTGQNLETIGAGLIRYGLVIVLLWIGGLKFTSYEAQGIQPLVAHSPFMSWVYSIMSVQGFSVLLGIVEIALGVLIAIRNFAPKASAIGSTGAIVMFLTTLSFMLSTPGVVQPEHSFPLISPMPGQFLLKDIVLLGAACWTAGEAFRAARSIER